MSVTTIIKKNEGRKLDPKRGESNPNFELAHKIGQENLKQWDAEKRWDSPKQRDEYIAVGAKNPHNAPGLPPFFPPLEIKSFINYDAMRRCRCAKPVKAFDEDGYELLNCRTCLEPIRD